MPQIVGDRLHIHAVLQSQGRVCVAEIMEAYFGKPHLGNNSFEMVVNRHAGQMLAQRIGEHQIQIIVVGGAILQLPFSLSKLLLFQNTHYAGGAMKSLDCLFFSVVKAQVAFLPLTGFNCRWRWMLPVSRSTQSHVKPINSLSRIPVNSAM